VQFVIDCFERKAQGSGKAILAISFSSKVVIKSPSWNYRGTRAKLSCSNE